MPLPVLSRGVVLVRAAAQWWPHSQEDLLALKQLVTKESLTGSADARRYGEPYLGAVQCSAVHTWGHAQLEVRTAHKLGQGRWGDSATVRRCGSAPCWRLKGAGPGRRRAHLQRRRPPSAFTAPSTEE